MPKIRMKNKSYKITKLERKRFSLLTDDLTTCYICKMPKDNLHEIYEGSNRINSMKYGCVLPLCFRCHQMIHKSNTLSIQYKKVFQELFEEKYNLDFVSIFHHNYKD